MADSVDTGTPVDTHPLRIVREALGLSVEDLARAAGVSHSYLGRVERWEVEPTDSWLVQVLMSLR